ncbi:MAG TPA: phosphoribosylglycinamide formyltransferase [Fibrobacteraceae bacterium]|nr:phosphoribosylglycinamide formyltransferase [Fibrobacteraceae bacterium]
MFNFGVMASGNGSNFKALLSQIESKRLKAVCSFLIVNNKNCGAAQIAKSNGIPVYHISSVTHPDSREYDQAFLNVIKQHPIDFLVLAGYMKKITDSLLVSLKDRILNIHPSLLPKYGGHGFFGIHVHEAVLEANEGWSGATVHLVNGDYDDGRILGQSMVPVFTDDTPEILAARVLKAEHNLYWKTLRDYAASLGY